MKFCMLMDCDAPEFDELLRLLSFPGEGRLRHLLANSVRTRTDKKKVVGYLVQWLENETDEFARRAIEAALDDVDLSAYKMEARVTLADPMLVNAYRYAHARLAHKIRNGLGAPEAHILRLRDRVESSIGSPTQGELLDMLAKLQDAFQKVGRIVEFDPEDQWFRMRSVCLVEWLRTMNMNYARKYEEVNLEITPRPIVNEARIRASDHLLDSIFWNLWINSQQAVKGSCFITVRMEYQRDHVALTLVDNGDGFDPPQADSAFKEAFTTRSKGHGRGLLEVQAAIDELLGRAAITRQPAGDYRIRLSFPRERI